MKDILPPTGPSEARETVSDEMLMQMEKERGCTRIPMPLWPAFYDYVVRTETDENGTTNADRVYERVGPAIWYMGRGRYARPDLDISPALSHRIAMEELRRHLSEKGLLAQEDGYDCPLCRNTGRLYCIEPVPDKPGHERVCEYNCSCLNERRIRKTRRRLGLTGQGRVMELGTFRAREPWQETLKTRVAHFIDGLGVSDQWLYIGGQSGSGKTHLCTAVCEAAIQRDLPVDILRWPTESERMRGMAYTDSESYAYQMRRWQEVPLLYIDDLFKTTRDEAGHLRAPSPQELRLAFELLSNRAEYGKRVTLISSEMTLPELCAVDEGIAGRIAERCGDAEHVCEIRRGIERNWRLKLIAGEG